VRAVLFLSCYDSHLEARKSFVSVKRIVITERHLIDFAWKPDPALLSCCQAMSLAWLALIEDE
jgi:hypothetical protein